MLRTSNWLAAVFLFSLPHSGEADPYLFADVEVHNTAPKNLSECVLDTNADCLFEYQAGRFDGSQQHRSIAGENSTLEKLRPPWARLLLLVTSIWKNRQRRRLLRTALHRCWWGYKSSNDLDIEAVQWRFLLGDVPSAPVSRRLAIKETAEKGDILILNAADEMSYAHIGDAYELREANPELVKLVLALRWFTRSLRFDYLLFADDDSFINIPAAWELTQLLPPSRVYVGNMIDTIPQRYDAKVQAIRPEYTVNLYLSTPSKVPIFAHGMGCLVSRDVADLWADVGLKLKARGNDDMLIGLWMRNIEHAYYLHYWPWFHDHAEFDGAFSRQCDVSAVVVHRMTPERWRTFNGAECHLCGPPQHPLDVEPEVAELSAPPTPPPPQPRCIDAKELSCAWEPALRASGLGRGRAGCVQTCQSEGTFNMTRSAARALGVQARGQASGRCPAALCHALCQPSDSSTSSLCPRKGKPHRRHGPKPDVVIVIFGSRWVADRELRSHLRDAILTCSATRFGAVGVRHLFVMPLMPAHDTNTDARREAVAETVRWRDLAIVAETRTKRRQQSATAVGGETNPELGTYTYADVWRLVEENFGGSDYILMLDHRSYVNVPALAHMILPQIPREGVYLGCLIDETLFGKCDGHGTGLCAYLWRRRAPMFAHGMGILVSSDVAQIVADMAARVPLREDDVAADTAFGMWVQPLEDLMYESVHDQFHEWPPMGSDAFGADVFRGISGSGSGADISQKLSDVSVVVFPMTVERWKSYFDGRTCTLTTDASRDRPSRSTLDDKSKELPAEVAAADVIEEQVSEARDCWSGMGGRAEAWHLVCCQSNWTGCWGGDFTHEVCCQESPPPSQHQWLQPAPQKDVGSLQRFLNFSHDEVQLLLVGLDNITAHRSASAERFGCLTPTDCAREAFARLYQHFWDSGVLPLRHPWITDVQDHLFGVALKLRSENDGWGPKGHEHTLERVQLAEWLRLTAEHIAPEHVPGEKRCLEWDSAQYSRHYFQRHCKYFDVIAYDGESEKMITHATGSRRFLVDIHRAEAVVPAGSLGVVVCAQIFEHLKQPFVAMAQLFRAVAAGGVVIWSAPMFSELHGAPDDYYRYTPQGAKVLAESAGFEVEGMYAPGGLKELAGYYLGITAPYWQKDELLHDAQSSWPLQVYMLLRRPR